jgi:hypothetical protein
VHMHVQLQLQQLQKLIVHAGCLARCLGAELHCHPVFGRGAAATLATGKSASPAISSTPTAVAANCSIVNFLRCMLQARIGALVGAG